VRRYVCIHGHFYQPPRENAWTEIVERQPSARPYHDWNQRITAECYGPNARARVLGEGDRIVQIVNNYARTSFNVGPTLLSWLEEASPRTYSAILEADVESQKRFSGHGSAIAQAYSHMILPLASARDRETQVKWGVADFEKRFRRKPEGMWLAETAVDTASLEALAAEGIRYTILCPRQAKSVRKLGATSPTPVDESTLDTRRAYRVDLPSGKHIAVFFYDGGRSQAVAFERLLSDGSGFARRLLSGFDASSGPQLVHIATDGETYGHHHRFGEMALAWATTAIEREPDVRLTNYGEFLARHPPEHVAEIVERSSWSCFHGVGRWSTDCGCRTRADSNQAWRGPLRDALDRLRERVDALFESEGARLFRDPWEARNAYVDVVLDRSDTTQRAFFDRVRSRALDADDEVRALMLLEMQRHAMLMYTSCGWFFDDVFGIETTQILQYAVRALEIAERLGGEKLLDGFLSDLEPARSIVVGTLGAREVVEQRVLPHRVDLTRVGMHHAVFAALQIPRRFETRAHTVEPLAERFEWSGTPGSPTLALGRMRVRHRFTADETTHAFAVAHLGEQRVRGALSHWEDGHSFDTLAVEIVERFRAGDAEGAVEMARGRLALPIDSLDVLLVDDHRRIFEALIAESVSRVEGQFRRIHEDCSPLLRYIASTPVDPPRIIRTATRLVIGVDLARELSRDAPSFERLEALVAEARSLDVRLDEEELGVFATRLVERLCARVESHPADHAALGELSRAVDICREVTHGPDFTRAQDLVWALTRKPEGGGAPPPPGSVLAELAEKLHLVLRDEPPVRRRSSRPPPASRPSSRPSSRPPASSRSPKSSRG
jgi:alpha-amylase/alpha-mannosidase (GH57 family)